MGRIGFPANVPGIPFHHWSGGAALASTIAHKGTLAGTKTLAGALIDLFARPDDLARAKATFTAESGDVKYRPLLPADQKPPLALNRQLMERSRPLMKPHYLETRPHFT